MTSSYTLGVGAYEAAIVALFSAYFVVSVLGQFDLKTFDNWRYYDVFALVPIWTFFAPSPGQSDYHLIYRDQLPDGTLTDWTEVAITERRNKASFLWNPEKRTKKVLSDVVAMAMGYVRDGEGLGREFILTFPYLVLLNAVCGLPASGEGARRQFLVVETFGFQRQASSMRLLITSELHPLSAASGVTPA